MTKAAQELSYALVPMETWPSAVGETPLDWKERVRTGGPDTSADMLHDPYASSFRLMTGKFAATVARKAQIVAGWLAF